MLNSSKTFMIAVGALAVLGLAMSVPEVQARPLYLKQFVAQYPNVANDARMKKCFLCHQQEKYRNVRNEYGQAVTKGLGKKANGDPVKNERNAAKVEAALTKAENVKSAKTGKTFGEMIEAGQLPE